MSPSLQRSINLPTLKDTIALGRHLGNVAEPGDIFTLSGDLGAGKTTLTQAIGQGIGVPKDCYITSPTFSLLHEYPGRISLYHMDLYRLSNENEFLDLGFEEYLYGDGLTVIEWPDRLGSLMPESRLHLELTIIDEISRSVDLSSFGELTARLSSFFPAP
jgi:tRNA threonylcarbamoyladenosine biosynthesis protein TsaE